MAKHKPAGCLAARLQPAERRRLGAGLALSLLCHVLIFGLAWRIRPLPPPPLAKQLLVVEWRPAVPGARREAASHRDVADIPASPVPPRPVHSPVAKPPSDTHPAPTGAAYAILRPGGGDRPSDATALLDSARRHLDAESRRRMLDPMFAPPAPPTPAVAPNALARALAPQEQSFDQAAGIVRVTTANGRQYCLQAMPEAVARGLPLPPTSVPTNCP